MNSTAVLALVLSLACLMACHPNASKELVDDNGAGSIVGMNYTGNGIQQFSVDGAWGGNIGSYGGGGTVCCAVYPKKWTPDLKVTVKWERSDGREPNGKRLKLIWLADDQVVIYISNLGVADPNFPGKPGYPKILTRYRVQHHEQCDNAVDRTARLA